MKKLLITAIFVLAGAMAFAQIDKTPPLLEGCDTQECYVEHIHQIIQENLRYPEDCEENKIEGRVFISYDISEEGNVENVRLIQGVHPSLNKAALTMAQSFPRHLPARQNGHPVPYTYTLPISFILR